MADTLATLIVKLIADTGDMTTGVKKAQDVLDRFAEMDADRPLIRLRDAATATNTSMGTFATGLSQVDRTLYQFGLNLTPQVAALREMAAISGKTASQLGLLGTGLAAAAAGFGGWKLGRWIADLTESDRIIGDFTAKLLGMGDVAGEVATYKLDLLAKASKAVGYEVTILADATRIMADEAKRLADALTTPEANMARVRGEVAEAQRAFRALSDEQRINIERMLEWGKSSTEIEKLLHLQAGTVDVLIDRLKLKADQDKRNAEIAEESAKKEQKAHAEKIAAMEKADNEYRDHRNMIGELLMQEDAARMKAEEAAHAAHVATLMQQASLLLVGMGGAPSLAGRGTVTFGPNGEMVTGGGEQFVPGSNITTFSGAPPAPPPLFSVASGAQGGAFTGGLADFSRGGGVTVNVDARESMFDTPEGQRRLFDRVGGAAVSTLRGSGVGVR